MVRRFGFRVCVLTLALGVTGVLALPTAGYPQTGGMMRREDRRVDRQDARDTKQTGRQDARDAKAECLAGDESRAECRQEKRAIKQDSREEARDIKYGD